MVNYAAIDTVVNSPTFGQVALGAADAVDAAESAVPVLMASARFRIGMRVAPAVALLAGVAVQAARPSPGQQAPQARFRAATELVSVDVIVRDKAGASCEG